MKTFTLEVITPEQGVYEGPVVSLTVPAEGGSLGVLPNHAALLTPVAIGEVQIVEENGEELHLMVSDGFLEVENNRARLLVEVGERADDINEERAQKAEKRARQRLKESHSDSEFDLARAEAALRRALMRQRIRRRRPKRA